MESITIIDILATGAIIWLGILTFFLLKTIRHYKKLIKSAHNLDLEKVLETVFKQQNGNTSQIAQIHQHIVELEIAAKSHIQKYALVRFNPFEDTGGDQSFIAAFLDAKDNGLVISSLHSRTGTRVYAKEVVGGKPTAHLFSREEKEVVEKAAHHN